MTMKERVYEFLLAGAATFVSAVVVMFLWSVIVDGTTAVDWATAVVLAIAVGMSMVVTEAWSEKHRAEA